MPGPDEHSIGQLVADASRDLSTLIRDEIALAKSELKSSAAAAGAGGGMLAGAAILGIVAFLFLSVAAAYGLVAAGLHESLGFLIVAGCYLLVAAILVLVGVRALRKTGPPRRTMKSIDDTKALLKRDGSKPGASDTTELPAR